MLGTTSPGTSAVVDTRGRVVGTTPTALVNSGLVAANNAASGLAATLATQQQQPVYMTHPTTGALMMVHPAAAATLSSYGYGMAGTSNGYLGGYVPHRHRHIHHHRHHSPLSQATNLIPTASTLMPAGTVTMAAPGLQQGMVLG